MNEGQRLAKLFAADVAQRGVTVTLPNGTTAKALLVNNIRELSRFERIDGHEPEKKPFVWVFPGTMLGMISPGDDLTVAGVKYRADTPIHPKWVGDVCVRLAVPSYQF